MLTVDDEMHGMTRWLVQLQLSAETLVHQIGVQLSAVKPRMSSLSRIDVQVHG